MSPDYTRTVRDVYIDAARFILEAEGDLHLLSLKESRSDVEGLPSWVPDFSVAIAPINDYFYRSNPWSATDGLGPTQLQFLPVDSLKVCWL